jgi:CyaY protein
MTETEFINRADAVLFEIGEALDATDLDCDWEVSEGILTIDLEHGKVIVNRHALNREIWLASSATGGAHFRYDGSQWRDTRGGDSLADGLNRAVSALSGVAFVSPPL